MNGRGDRQDSDDINEAFTGFRERYLLLLQNGHVCALQGGGRQGENQREGEAGRRTGSDHRGVKIPWSCIITTLLFSYISTYDTYQKTTIHNTKCIKTHELTDSWLKSIWRFVLLFFLWSFVQLSKLLSRNVINFQTFQTYKVTHTGILFRYMKA